MLARSHGYMHSHRCSAGISGQTGAALVVALLVFAVCAGLMVAMQREFALFSQRGSNLFLGEQGYAYLRGAEELASVALVLDYDQDKVKEKPRDDLSEVWAREATPFPLEEGGFLMGSLEDLQGRFNLNALAERSGEGEGAERFTPAQAQFIRLLQSLGDASLTRQDAIALTEAVGDWLDPDQEARFNGAEDDYYFVKTPAYRTANRAMASVSELRAIANMSDELFLALEPWVTVWPSTPRPINIHTAPATVLRSINSDGDLDPLDEADVEALVVRRETEGYIDKSAFLEDPVFAGKTLEQTATLLGERSSYFLLSALVEIADREMRLYSVLHRDRRQVKSLVRASGSL